MSNYVAVVRKNSDEDVEHYGVLGMKWGVRRASKALSNATTKEAKAAATAKLEKHAAKAGKKLAKIDKRINKHQAKATKSLRKTDNFVDPFRKHHNRKADKQGRKATRQMRKADKWFKNMEKAFKDTTVTFSPEQVAAGQKYIESLKTRSTRSMGY